MNLRRRIVTIEKQIVPVPSVHIVESKKELESIREKIKPHDLVIFVDYGPDDNAELLPGL